MDHGYQHKFQSLSGVPKRTHSGEQLYLWVRFELVLASDLTKVKPMIFYPILVWLRVNQRVFNLFIRKQFSLFKIKHKNLTRLKPPLVGNIFILYG